MMTHYEVEILTAFLDEERMRFDPLVGFPDGSPARFDNEAAARRAAGDLQLEGKAARVVRVSTETKRTLVTGKPWWSAIAGLSAS